MTNSYLTAYAIKFLKFLVYLSTLCTVGVLSFIVIFILIHGIPALTPNLFNPVYTSANVSLLPSLIGTIIMTFLTMIISVPIGICAAIFLVEYSSSNNIFIHLIRMMTETLQGIPSIIYGLFGLIFFVTQLKWGLSLLSGACTLAIMTLPVIIRTTEEALLTVPQSYREASLSLGVGKVDTIFHCVLPTALPGIISGILLSIGRCVGEVGALLFTAGTVSKIPNIFSGTQSLFTSCRTLSVHMYVLASEGFHINETYATAVVLLLMILVINYVASTLTQHLQQEN